MHLYCPFNSQSRWWLISWAIGLQYGMHTSNICFSSLVFFLKISNKKAREILFQGLNKILSLGRVFSLIFNWWQIAVENLAGLIVSSFMFYIYHTFLNKQLWLNSHIALKQKSCFTCHSRWIHTNDKPKPTKLRFYDVRT